MLKTAAVFSDHMVLQRDKNINIWGYTDSGEVSVTINNNTVTTISKDGKWNVILSPMPAGGPYEMRVASGNETISFCDVMLGEVWLAGGQSNMEFELYKSLNGNEILKELNENINVRYYYTLQQKIIDEDFYKAENNTCWSKASPENSKNWSAAAFHFALRLSKKLGVTVGIIGCNWGGTSACAWMSRDFLSGIEEISSYLKEYDDAVQGKTNKQMIEEYDEFTQYDTAWAKKMNKCYEEDPSISWDEIQNRCGINKWPGPMGIKNPYRPCGLHETMLSRVKPYTIKGFLYYQGESDDHKPDSYYTLLTQLIANWRYDWNDSELPFIMVQLPMFKYEYAEDNKNWCKIREAQMQAYKTIKNTGIAVIADCGEFNNIHPIDKEPVGERLFLQAMYQVYNDTSISAFGPLYKSCRYLKNGIELYFDYANEGFIVKDNDLIGFEIAGFDKHYYSASAKINGSSIFISSENVKYPLYARYAWTNYMEIKIFGKNGIPLAPFKI